MVTFLNFFVTRTCLRVASVMLAAADLVRRSTARLLWKRRIHLVDAKRFFAAARHLNRAAIRLIRITPCSRNDDEY